MRIVKKVFGFIFYGMFALAMLFLFIAGCLHLEDSTSLSLAGNVLMVIVGLAGLAGSALGIVFLAKGKHDNLSSSFGLIILAAIAVIYLILGYAAFEFYEDDALALFVMSLPYAATLIVASCLVGEKCKTARKVLSIIGVSFTAVIVITWYSTVAGQMEALDIIAATFLMLACLGGIPYYAMFNNREKIKTTIKSSNKAENKAFKAELKAEKAKRKAEKIQKKADKMQRKAEKAKAAVSKEEQKEEVKQIEAINVTSDDVK